MVLNNCYRVCRESKEEDNLEELVQQVTLRLTKELPKPFTENDKTHEPTVLFHDNLSAQNILVDENGVVTAALDWGLASGMSHNCSIRAPFSVARFVISGGYYCGSFESIIKLIV